MTIGEKIRKYRNKLNISQKKLADKCHLSEPAIRNYELGNRTPSAKQLQVIANALDVSKYAISDPHLDSYDGIMHTLFYLEEKYGLVPYTHETINSLRFDHHNSKDAEIIDTLLGDWKKKRTELEQGEITPAQYENWISSYASYMHKCED